MALISSNLRHSSTARASATKRAMLPRSTRLDTSDLKDAKALLIDSAIRAGRPDDLHLGNSLTTLKKSSILQARYRIIRAHEITPLRHWFAVTRWWNKMDSNRRSRVRSEAASSCQFQILHTIDGAPETGRRTTGF